MNNVAIYNFISYQKTIPAILDELDLASKIQSQKQILIKPNLTTKVGPPVTTDVELTEEIIKYSQKHSQAKITVAEGSGGCETNEAFKSLEYDQLAQKYKIKLIDLNNAERIERNNPHALKLKKVKLPKIAFKSFIINLSQLKEHSEAKLTAAMKNVFGFYLNREFLSKVAGRATRSLGVGWWNKSELHFYGVNESIIDLNSYIHFDFSLVDGSVGMKKQEVHGLPCSPPIGKIIAGYDTKKVDIICAKLLDLDLEKIKYLK